MIRTALFVIMTSLVLLPVVAGAQLPRGNWWQNEQMKKALQLSEKQIEKIKKIVEEGQKTMAEQRQKYGEKSKELREMMNVEKLRNMADDQLEKMLDEIQNMRGKIEKARFLTMVKTIRVLTEEQAAKLSEKQKEMRKQIIERFKQKQAPRFSPHTPHGKEKGMD